MPGPKPNPNARRNGDRIAISPHHSGLLNDLLIKSKGNSKADIVEALIERAILLGLPIPIAAPPHPTDKSPHHQDRE
jgi:hypothetical protein